jgi:hypothetical protein
MYYLGFLRSVRRLLFEANVVPSSQILITLFLEAIGSSETSVLITTTKRNIPEDGILHSHCRENLKSYIALTGGLCSGVVICLLWSTNWVFVSQKTAFFIVSVVKSSNLTTFHWSADTEADSLFEIFWIREFNRYHSFSFSFHNELSSDHTPVIATLSTHVITAQRYIH